MVWPNAEDVIGPLLPWFEAVKRSLPWRALDLDEPHPNPYAVLCSEVMLQQTQVVTVVPYFNRWMERFPNLKSLAGAEDDEVHLHWQGLGYYRRAHHFQRAAQVLVEKGWPGDFEGLSALPGLGPYTAAAVASIAFQWPEAALDGNAFRVLARLLALEGDPRKQAVQLRTWLKPALKHLGPSRVTQGMMELGATLCRREAACGVCPLAGVCQAHLQNKTGSIPPPKVAPKVQLLDLYLLGIEAEGHVLMHAPSSKGLLAGLWRFPVREVLTQDLAASPQRPYGLLSAARLEGWTQAYTHRKEKIQPIWMQLEGRFEVGESLCWIPKSTLLEKPMGRRDQRLRDWLLKDLQAPLLSEDAPWAWLLSSISLA